MIAGIDELNTSNGRLIYGDLIDDPEVSETERLNRLALAVAAMRAMLNDPAALARRAADLMDGTAKPLLTFAVVGLTVVRMSLGPVAVPNHATHPRARHAPAVAVLFDGQRRNVA